MTVSSPWIKTYNSGPPGLELTGYQDMESSYKVFLVAAVLAVAAADSPAPYHPTPAPYHPAPAYKPALHHPQTQYKEEAMPFAFEYAVNDHYTGTNFARNEQSDGHNVQGYYSVVLPDGRTQHVKYTADHYGGYNAEVTYDGQAAYPTHHAAPAYKAGHH
ncbi:cuticle protein 7-like [Amphibalanus amphitrite]|uniref:cuticle protein 7-like n=1 Tax=Amphibalanus amphitrite TaxID=1232801 RepID=UPI001C92A575|nr:cuticle protein 7-like [Amphibalanus amphitrite]XP_043229304.1 cuticle protein 7-like [Amphibalanus amphitrite]